MEMITVTPTKTLKKRITIPFTSFFREDEVIVHNYPFEIVIQFPNLDYQGKTVKVNKKSDHVYLNIHSDIPYGRYSIDRTSNEDILVIKKFKKNEQ